LQRRIVSAGTEKVAETSGIPGIDLNTETPEHKAGLISQSTSTFGEER